MTEENSLPLVLGFGLLSSISTNLRMAVFPIGPSELILAMLAVIGVVSRKLRRNWKEPVILLWIVACVGMLFGTLAANQKGALADHHSMAYAFTAVITIGLSALLLSLSDEALRRVIYWLCVLTTIGLWFGFVVYLSGDIDLAQMLKTRIEFDLFYIENWSV